MWECEGFFWGPLSFQGVAKGDGISDPSGALSKGMLWLICAAVSAEKVSIAEKAFSATVKSIFGVLAFPRGKRKIKYMSAWLGHSGFTCATMPSPLEIFFY